MAELESKGQLTRNEVALFLREFADELADGSVGRQQEEHLTDTVEERQTDTAEERRTDTSEETASGLKRVTLIVGGDSGTVSIPETIDFDVHVESRSPMLGSGVDQGIEFDLSWEIEDPDQINEDWLDVE